jgi:hypothetical protein
MGLGVSTVDWLLSAKEVRAKARGSGFLVEFEELIVGVD